MPQHHLPSPHVHIGGPVQTEKWSNDSFRAYCTLQLVSHPTLSYLPAAALAAPADDCQPAFVPGGPNVSFSIFFSVPLSVNNEISLSTMPLPFSEQCNWSCVRAASPFFALIE